MKHRAPLAILASSLITFALAAPACSAGVGESGGATTTSNGPSGSGGAGAGQGGAGQGGSIFTGGVGGSGQGGGPESCIPPDMLIVLDRTMSMHKRPDGTIPPDTVAGHAESKWYIAIQAVETLTKSLDQTIRFGLELFPKDPGMNKCITLSQRIQGITATNTMCQAGEVVVPPNLSTAAPIDATLDPETTLLCTSTPIGAGLVTAKDALAAIATPNRPQFVVLLTDGAETCDNALPLAQVQALAKAGVKTYVIGFDATTGMADGIDKTILNKLACAGQVSTGFPDACVDDGKGNFTWDDASAKDVFLLAQDGATLDTLLAKLGGDVCCDCTPE